MITTVRFTAPQLAMVARAHPGVDFRDLGEVTFVFGHSGNLVDCTGIGQVDVDYRGPGLVRLFERAQRQSARMRRPTPRGVVVQFPGRQA